MTGSTAAVCESVGVGVGKMAHIIEEHGELHIDLMRRIKRALDPRNIMNPNSMFTIDGSAPPQQSHQGSLSH